MLLKYYLISYEFLYIKAGLTIILTIIYNEKLDIL